jgi:polyamine oxidase
MRIRPALLSSLVAISATAAKPGKRTKDAQVLILGGGMAGTIAARTLHEKGIEDYIIVEGKIELGGRILSHAFGTTEHNYTVELGPSWIHGTQTGNGPANPVYSLALKHNLSMVNNDWYGNMSRCIFCYKVLLGADLGLLKRPMITQGPTTIYPCSIMPSACTKMRPL